MLYKLIFLCNRRLLAGDSFCNCEVLVPVFYYLRSGGFLVFVLRHRFFLRLRLLGLLLGVIKKAGAAPAVKGVESASAATSISRAR
nr:hypothetical protein [Klebsiella pneumoniae subsp. pneumoniae]